MPNVGQRWPEPEAFGTSEDLRAIEFRALAARRVAALGKNPTTLKILLTQLATDVCALIDRLRDRGDP